MDIPTVPNLSTAQQRRLAEQVSRLKAIVEDDAIRASARESAQKQLNTFSSQYPVLVKSTPIWRAGRSA